MIRRNTPRSSRLHFLALACVLGLALVGLSQCRSVSDQMTGISLNAPQTLSGRSNCARRCNTQFKAEIVAEERRHIAAKRACGFDWACKKNEDRVHSLNLRRILEHKQLCKRSCYNEGAGNSGA
jgi:hypothetical protein